jgi:hypothetical protein
LVLGLLVSYSILAPSTCETNVLWKRINAFLCPCLEISVKAEKKKNKVTIGNIEGKIHNLNMLISFCYLQIHGANEITTEEKP